MIEGRFLEGVVVTMLFVLVVPHEDKEATLSVSAVRSEEGVLRTDVALVVVLQRNGEGGGVTSRELPEGSAGLNSGESGGEGHSASSSM